MDYDPLSPPTRRTRRAVLGVSGSVVLTSIYCAHLENLPAGGFSFSVNTVQLTPVLLIVMGYLLVLFAIYLRIDWNNRRTTPAEEQLKQDRSEQLLQVQRELEEEIRRTVKRFEPGRQAEICPQVLNVFLRMKRNPIDPPDNPEADEPDVVLQPEEVTDLLVKAELVHAGATDPMLDDLTNAIQKGWKDLDAGTVETTIRTIRARKHERNRVIWVEGLVPFVMASIAVIASGPATDTLQDLFGLDRCDAKTECVEGTHRTTDW